MSPPLTPTALRPPAAGGGPDPLIGASLGERYLIEDFLQRGGMGAVYRARHKILPKSFAIKILEAAQDEVAQQRFLQEAQSACLIGHAHTVDILDYGILSDGRPFLVMEYLEGRTLDDILSDGPLTPPRACLIGAQIALGLQAVHDQGIIHRDLKPGNIMVLRRDGADFVKVLDFGIAKVLSEPAEFLGPPGRPRRTPTLTQPGMIIGTVEYLAPERASGERGDSRADQYALGCMLYEMLTGALPFLAEEAGALMGMHMHVAPAPPRQRFPALALSDELEGIVLRTLAKDPEERYPSMRDLAQALVRAGERLSPGAFPGVLSPSGAGLLLRPEEPTAPREAVLLTAPREAVLLTAPREAVVLTSPMPQVTLPTDPPASATMPLTVLAEATALTPVGSPRRDDTATQPVRMPIPWRTLLMLGLLVLFGAFLAVFLQKP